MQPFLALITPVSSGTPTPPIYYPPYPDQGLPPYPSHPIAPGGSPGTPTHPIYNPPYPDQGLPGQPPGIWPSPGYPSHPIAPGGPTVLPAVTEAQIGTHPEKPDPEAAGVWVLVAIGGGAIAWAWMEPPEPVVPDQGLPTPPVATPKTA